MTDMPIRVVHCLDSLEISGGVQAAIMNVYRNIDKSKVQFDFAAYDVPESNSYVNEIEKLGGRVFKVDNLSTAMPVGFYKQFKKLFKEEKFNAVHAHNIQHNGIILMAAKHSKITNRISHSHQTMDDRNVGLAKNIFNKVLMCLNLHYASKRVACSDLAAEFLYGKKSYIFLPNGINTEKFLNADLKDESTFKKELGIKQAEAVITHIGRFAPPKNHFYFVEILKNLPEYFKYKMLFIGEGDLKEEFCRLVEQNGLQDKCLFLGVRSDIPDILSITNVFLLPSISEGLPVSVVESQEMGVPSLISDVITRQADLGIGLVKYLSLNNSSAWAENIVNLCNEKNTVSKEQIIAAIKKSGFDMESCVENFCKLYEV